MAKTAETCTFAREPVRRTRHIIYMETVRRFDEWCDKKEERELETAIEEADLTDPTKKNITQSPDSNSEEAVA